MTTVPASDLPGRDLCEVVREALAKEGHLLTAGEITVARAVVALGDAAAREGNARDALELYARLTLRKDAVFFVADLRYALDVPAAVARLVEVGLAWTQADEASRLAVADVSRLRAACVRAGLSARGTRAELHARLIGGFVCREPVIVVRHRALLRRLERLCFGRSGVDRSVYVLERLGMVRWAEYVPTGGAGVHASRRQMLLWERARSGRWDDGAEAERVALAGPAGAGLCPWRYAVEALVAGDADATLLARLRATGARVEVPLVRALEREGRALDALALCEAVVEASRAQDGSAAEDAVALARSGRRLARALGRGWCSPALRDAPRRVLRLPPGPRVGARPGWRVDGLRTVEDAVLALDAMRARGAVHAENALWTTAFALVFAEAYWLPVPGMLPTARRYGPLDLGTPAFAARRAEAVAATLDAVASHGVAPYAQAWAGERLAGLDPRMVEVAAGVPGDVARVILGRLAREGWGVARGLPDLWVPPGAPCRVEEAIPARVGSDALLVEVKGPGDALQDAQTAWIHHLLENNISVELWEVRSS